MLLLHVITFAVVVAAQFGLMLVLLGVALVVAAALLEQADSALVWLGLVDPHTQRRTAETRVLALQRDLAPDSVAWAAVPRLVATADKFQSHAEQLRGNGSCEFGGLQCRDCLATTSVCFRFAGQQRPYCVFSIECNGDIAVTSDAVLAASPARATAETVMQYARAFVAAGAGGR
jgi:hypothetical protein